MALLDHTISCTCHSSFAYISHKVHFRGTVPLTTNATAILWPSAMCWASALTKRLTSGYFQIKINSSVLLRFLKNLLHSQPPKGENTSLLTLERWVWLKNKIPSISVFTPSRFPLIKTHKLLAYKKLLFLLILSDTINVQCTNGQGFLMFTEQEQGNFTSPSTTELAALAASFSLGGTSISIEKCNVRPVRLCPCSITIVHCIANTDHILSRAMEGLREIKLKCTNQFNYLLSNRSKYSTEL